MGVTKQYLRYAASGLFGLIGSSRSNIVFLNIGESPGRFCAVAACEHVFIWDLRKVYKVRTLAGDRYEATRLARSPDNRHLAVGYADGTIRIFDVNTGDLAVTFSGHKSSVTALAYDQSGMRLTSGSLDTNIIVWDIINEAGLFRLKGHKGVVTQLSFLSGINVLISSSKDTYVKFWDLDTQHCFRTLIGHKTEVWDFVVCRQESLLITGSGDNELRVWKLACLNQGEVLTKRRRVSPTEEDSGLEDDSESDTEEETILSCGQLGSVLRTGKGRVYSLNTDPSGQLLGCHGSDASMELFQINSEYAAQKLRQKKMKKMKRKAKEAGLDDETSADDTQMSVEYDVRRLTAVKMSSKLRSFDCLLEDNNKARVVTLLANNTLELFHIDAVERGAEASDVMKVATHGHCTDVRTLCWSSDNTAIMSAAGDAVKVWNRDTLQCIRTMKCDYGLCSVFVPGDRHAVIGTKSGKLQLFDIASGAVLESLEAHEGVVWSICLAPDKRSLVSGSADHEVKFWEFELISDEEYSATSKRLSLVHTRTLKMAEDVLCVKFSPDQRFLAVSLLDNTVKVFFADTLKFFLSLYGHKLPVLCMDISDDSTLLVTGSADRNIKLWGLDFGDCHRSICAHDDSIMCVQFVPKTHLFFSGGKDGKLKQWDGDSFEHILTLEGHHSEVWALSVSPSGNFVTSAAHDKSLRLWEKTPEPLVLEVEREHERERQQDLALGASQGESLIAGETEDEAGIAGKKTVETVKAAERLMEALDVYKEETAKLEQHRLECLAHKAQLPPPPLHPLLQAFKVATPSQYVWQVLKKTRSSELEESLLMLPFSHVTDLILLLDTFIALHWDVELSCRCLLFLLRIHQGQITANQLLLPTLDKLRDGADKAVNMLRDTIGFNHAGLQFLKQQLEEKEKVQLFLDATTVAKQKRKKKAILAIKT